MRSPGGSSAAVDEAYEVGQGRSARRRASGAQGGDDPAADAPGDRSGIRRGPKACHRDGKADAISRSQLVPAGRRPVREAEDRPTSRRSRRRFTCCGSAMRPCARTQFELFTDYGVQIKARSRAVQTFLIQLAGGGPFCICPRREPFAAAATARSCRATGSRPRAGRFSSTGPSSRSIPCGRKSNGKGG